MHPTITFVPEHNRLIISGELANSGVPVFESGISQQPVQAREVLIELYEFDILDGVAATAAVNAVRVLLERCGKVTLIGAPQILAHNLYRVGMLADDGPIRLLDMREDEAYG